MSDYRDDEEAPQSKEELGRYWHAQLDNATKLNDPWFTKGEKVVKRYRDERDAVEQGRKKFNILWANTEVLTPSLYGRPAKPEVSRRFKDADPVGRIAATILERVLEFETTQFPDFDDAMRETVQDRLLPGRGVAWLRFEPEIREETLEHTETPEITDVEELPPPITTETVVGVRSPVDYVFWKDFLHSPARKWGEVWWVARWVYMTHKEGEERFGEAFKLVPLAEVPATDQIKTKDTQRLEKKAKVAEIWDKRTGKVCWVAKDFPVALDEQDDPLGLEGFFPCPKPLFATTTNGTLTPVSDYAEYQDQAQELDDVTNRIGNLVKAIKAVGVYNAEYKEVARLLSEGVDNKLFPVDQWGALAEKGGLKGAVELLDLTVQLQALGALYTSREQIKQVIYEICGISDILRGSTKAEETLGAQQLKANFGSLRLRRSQQDVARFASELFKLKAEIISKFYPPPLILQMSGIQQTADGQDPNTLNQAVELLKNSAMRDFHISVESDSLAQINEQEEKQAATEAIQAIASFLQQAIPMVSQAPETLPMASEMLLFLVRRFRAGRGLEAAIENAMKALQQKAVNAQQNPPPDPEMMKVQAQQEADKLRTFMDTQAAQQKAQFDMQVQQGKLQQEMQLEQLKAQLSERASQQDAQMKAQLAVAEDQFERWKAELDSKTKIQVALIAADAQKESEKVKAEAQVRVAAAQPKAGETE